MATFIRHNCGKRKSIVRHRCSRYSVALNKCVFLSCMFAIIQVGELKYKPHVLCIESKPLNHADGNFTPFSNGNQSQLATQNKAR